MIDWNTNGNDTIIQNATNLMRLTQYEIPYDLGRGIDPKILDQGLQSETLAISEAYRVIQLYEPRAKIISVSMDGPELNVEVTAE